jgi:hypothetical protein
MDWTKISLGGTIRNHLKKWLQNQNLPNNIVKPFFQNVFTTFFFWHACMHKYMALLLKLKKVKIITNLYS